MDNTPFKLPVRKEPVSETHDSGQEEKELSRGSLEDAKARNAYERDRQWQDKLLALKMRLLGIAGGVQGGAIGLAIVLSLLLLYLVVLWLIHSTGPTSWGWLSEEQRMGLDDLYSSVAGVSFPILMITNGWLI